MAGAKVYRERQKTTREKLKDLSDVAQDEHQLQKTSKETQEEKSSDKKRKAGKIDKPQNGD